MKDDNCLRVIINSTTGWEQWLCDRFECTAGALVLFEATNPTGPPTSRPITIGIPWSSIPGGFQAVPWWR